MGKNLQFPFFTFYLKYREMQYDEKEEYWWKGENLWFYGLTVTKIEEIQGHDKKKAEKMLFKTSKSKKMVFKKRGREKINGNEEVEMV